MAIKPKSQLEKRIDGLKAGGVGKNVGNDSEIFNRYEGSNANVIDGGYAAHAEGSQNTITGASFTSHAEGSENRISNSRGAHAEGNYNSVSISDYSHVEGEYNHISGAKWAHAGGYGCDVFKDGGFTHGINTMVGGIAAAAFGSQTYAEGNDQFVAGRGNKTDDEDKYALIIGNGTGTRGLSGFAPSNALTLDWEGNLWVAGTISAEGGGTGGKTYTAGDGISITSDKISVKPATKTTLGGVKAGEGIDISSDGTISTESKQSLTAGDGIAITDDVVSVKVGNGLEISADGAVSVTGGGGEGSYTAGSGIEITEDDVINVKQATSTERGGVILGEGLEYDAATGKTNTVPNIQQAVIIQEADAKYLLHEYTQVEYIAGNKIGYAGAQNQIIVQGYVVYKAGTVPDTNNYATEAGLPNLQFYSGFDYTKGVAYIDNNKLMTGFSLVPLAFYANYTNYQTKYTYADGTSSGGNINSANGYPLGLCLYYGNIYPPDSKYPYGYVNCGYGIKYGNYGSSTPYCFRKDSYQNQYIGFASEAEYNAAVGLTYEPNTLINVEETITEV